MISIRSSRIPKTLTGLSAILTLAAVLATASAQPRPATQPRRPRPAATRPGRTFGPPPPASRPVIVVPDATILATYVVYEPPPGPMKQGWLWITGTIQAESLTALDKALADYKIGVQVWNLSTDLQPPPPPDWATQARRVLVFLPPTRVKLYGAATTQATQPVGFGPEQQAVLAEATKSPNGRSLFLSAWDERPTTPDDPLLDYAYNEVLKSDWGLSVDSQYRICHMFILSPDPLSYQASPQRWLNMRGRTYPEHPARRYVPGETLYLRNTQPIVIEPSPGGAIARPILTTEGNPEFRLLNGQQIAALMKSRDRVRGWPSPQPPPREPPHVLAASSELPNGAKLVLTTIGASLQDTFLDQIRFDRHEEGLVTVEPPPSENARFIAGLLYWLADLDPPAHPPAHPSATQVAK